MGETRTRVQGEGCWQCGPGHPALKGARVPGSITWTEHVEAWKGYAARYPGQSAERMAERGGFGYSELVMFLGHPPATWEPHPDHLAEHARCQAANEPPSEKS